MNPESESFDQLRRLLALKRHEAPPPGYFEGFARTVVVRIKAGETGEGELGWQERFWQMSWLQSFWSALEARPALAGTAGVLACGLVIVGIFFSENLGTSGRLIPGTMADGSPTLAAPSSAIPTRLVDSPFVLVTNALNPLASRPASSSLFDQIQPLSTTPAAYPPRQN